MSEREQIIKGLECCASGSCMWCTYFRKHHCLTTLEKDAIELLKEQQETIVSLQSTINKLAKALAEQPEQKHGHWISYGYGYYRCSVCNDSKHMNFVPDYCSTCGAIMDEEVKQECQTEKK